MTPISDYAAWARQITIPERRGWRADYNARRHIGDRTQVYVCPFLISLDLVQVVEDTLLRSLLGYLP